MNPHNKRTPTLHFSAKGTRVRYGVWLFLFFIILFFFLIFSYVNFSFAACTTEKDCPEGEVCVKGECVKGRLLEIVYPEIPGEPTPKYVQTELPVYINYIFRFSIRLIGLLILGVLIYNGVNYLSSFGNPTKLIEARNGILSAFLGGLILLSAHLIFNTINPQLLILEPPNVEEVEPVIRPGVYLCNYKYEGIKNDLNDFLYKDLKTRIEAAKKIKNAMGTPGSKEKCVKIEKSPQLLEDFQIKAKSDAYTIFIVPRKDPQKINDPECSDEGPKDKSCWLWEYGAIFQEKAGFGGRCQFLLDTKRISGAQNNFRIYGQVKNFHPFLDFKARAITIFKKTEPPESAEGVTLYEGLDFNQVGAEEEEEKEKEKGLSPFISVFAQEIDPELGKKAYRPYGEGEIYIVQPDELKNVKAKKKDEAKGIIGLHHNTRSIEFDPKKGGFLAVLFGDQHKKCEVRRRSDTNLNDNSIGRCGKCGILWKKASCYPCLEKMYVIKGVEL